MSEQNAATTESAATSQGKAWYQRKSLWLAVSAVAGAVAAYAGGEATVLTTAQQVLSALGELF